MCPAAGIKSRANVKLLFFIRCPPIPSSHVPHLVPLPVKVNGDYSFKGQQNIIFRLAKVYCLQIAPALIADIQPVQSPFIGVEFKACLLFVIAVRALQPLEKPFGIAAGAKQPPGPLVLLQGGDIRLSPANWAI